MPKYRKKPVVVEAEQYTGPICAPDWESLPIAPSGVKWRTADMTRDRYPYVVTIHGQETWVQPGDWIITEPDGVHHYPCKPDVFATSYESVEQPHQETPCPSVKSS